MNIFCGWRVNELGPPVNFEVIGNGELWDALGQSVSQKTMNLARQGKTTCGSHAAQHPGPLGGKEKGAMMSNVSNKAKQQRVQIQRARRQGYQGRRCAKSREPSPENALWTSNCTKKARAHRMAKQNVKRTYTSSSHTSMATELA
jgi:hypothetical protein